MNSYNQNTIAPNTGGTVFFPIPPVHPITGQYIDNQYIDCNHTLQQSKMDGHLANGGLAVSIAEASMISTQSRSTLQREEDYMPFRLQESLLAIHSLPNNWNDHGAVAFSDAIIDRAKRVLATLCLDDERLMVFPTATQSIQIEWENASDSYCEIEVYSDHESIFTMEGDTVLIEIDCAENGYAEHVFMDFVREHR